jgi:transcriptional regulator with GAF, ATPase, and Fis domain
MFGGRDGGPYIRIDPVYATDAPKRFLCKLTALTLYKLCTYAQLDHNVQPMFEIPSREDLAALAARANAVAPTKTVGFVRSLDEHRVAIFGSTQNGLGEYFLENADLAANSVFEWHLQSIGAQSFVSVPIAHSEPPVRFWVGFSDPNPLTKDQHVRIERIADESINLLKPSLSPDAIAERLRRLEITAELLQSTLQVLDLREVFDRLSATAQKTLPHDLLLLRSFSEDLSKVRTYARTGGWKDLDVDLALSYPPAVIQAWNFDLLDDALCDRRAEDLPGVKLGVRSIMRFPIRFGDKLIGALGIMSKEPSMYSSEDVIIGRRLADYMAVALSHERLAEGRARAEKSEMLDEVLASVTSNSELHGVFDRISDVTQKVLPHDGLVVGLRMPDGHHGKVYASKTPPHAALPEELEIPPYVAAHPDWEFEVIEDLRADPGQSQMATAQKGYRSVLRVPMRVDNEFVAALLFLSFEPARYSKADVPIAKRIAERIALALARERGAMLLKQVDEATERAAKLELRVRTLTDELDARTGYRRVVGESTEWRQVLKQATQVAATDATVLLLGESGTGKEVVARFVHRASTRNNGPFVALNCAALPEHLLEAELFGYEKGAYTGATQSKPGQLEQAAGGTLFLDEVGEMSMSAQAKFLRVLQEREFQRLGGTRVLRTDARVVAATNRDLQRAISQGQFREDLYYRLNVFAIQLPALRDRREDVLPLSEAFLTEIGRSYGRPPAGISRDARQMLIDYHWPGNVRELRNILERAAILCDGGLITADHLALNVVATKPAVAPVAAAQAAAAPVQQPSSDLQSVERTMIEQALQNARFNKSKAAKALGLTRHQLYVRMKKHGFE